MCVQVFARELADFGGVTRRALMPSRHDDTIERLARPVFHAHPVTACFGLDCDHTAVEPDELREAEAVSVRLEVPLHFGVVRVERTILGKREVVVGADPRF